MKLFYTLMLCFTSLVIFAQTTLDFEEFTIEQDSFLNGSDLSGGFTTQNAFLTNDYNPEWSSWSGWALSNTTDVTSAGFTNQYSSIAGSGNNNSLNYATSFVSGATAINIDNELKGTFISELYVTNATYAYLSMRDGDAFAKKFGGETGDDPDFFLLTIKGFKNDVLMDSVEFYLADFRSDDNTEDYIINEWTAVNISSLGVSDSLSFTLSSSDNGQFGMNTPAYFCIDDLKMNFYTSNHNLAVANQLNVFPNPSSDYLNIGQDFSGADVSILDINGSSVLSIKEYNNQAIEIAQLPTGTYILSIKTDDKIYSQRVLKL